MGAGTGKRYPQRYPLFSRLQPNQCEHTRTPNPRKRVLLLIKPDRGGAPRTLVMIVDHQQHNGLNPFNLLAFAAIALVPYPHYYPLFLAMDDDDTLKKAKLYRHHAALLALLLGINAGHWLPEIAADPAPVGVEYVEVEVPVARTRPAQSLSARMRVQSTDDVAAARGDVIAAVFGGDLPGDMPAAVEDVDALGVSGQRLTMALPSGDLLEGYLLHAADAQRLAIYHAGHGQTALQDGGETIGALLAAGFDVLALDMPPEPHAMYAAMPRPLESFMRPVAQALNYALAQRDYRRVIMTGLSGGGWATVLYAALDPRIDASYPVAGSYPFYLREQQAQSRGDYEQQLPGLNVGYLDLYLMATDHGREQVQFFNRHDPCCFAGDLSLSYRDPLHRMAGQIGGSFDVVIDDEALHVLSRRVGRMVAVFAAQD